MPDESHKADVRFNKEKIENGIKFNKDLVVIMNKIELYQSKKNMVLPIRDEIDVAQMLLVNLRVNAEWTVR